MNTQSNLNLVLSSELARRRISAREAARQSGLSHTTIVRALRGDNVDLETIRLICAWLEIDPTKVVDFGQDQGDDRWMWRLEVLIASNASIRNQFIEIFEAIDRETIAPSIIGEIASFMAYSLRKHQPN
jgi:DNA-binding Xre family transcriptional regulator